jgi:hypothetical protein
MASSSAATFGSWSASSRTSPRPTSTRTSPPAPPGAGARGPAWRQRAVRGTVSLRAHPAPGARVETTRCQGNALSTLPPPQARPDGDKRSPWQPFLYKAPQRREWLPATTWPAAFYQGGPQVRVGAGERGCLPVMAMSSLPRRDWRYEARLLATVPPDAPRFRSPSTDAVGRASKSGKAPATRGAKSRKRVGGRPGTVPQPSAQATVGRHHK